jgi:hypothetical protein
MNQLPPGIDGWISASIAKFGKDQTCASLFHLIKVKENEEADFEYTVPEDANAVPEVMKQLSPYALLALEEAYNKFFPIA